MVEPRPIIILAPPRSFTSLVCAMIGQHPELIGLPELNLFFTETMDEWWSGWRPDETRVPFFPDVLKEGLLRTLAQIYAGEQTIDSVDMAKRWIRARLGVSTGEVYRELSQKVMPFRLVDKSPGYVSRWVHLERMKKTFPEATYIHLVRHPLGQGKSLMDRPGGTVLLLSMNSIDRAARPPVADPQIYWHDCQVRILRFLDGIAPERWMRIRGEDLLADLDLGLATICDKLGVSGEPTAIDAMKHPEQSPFACYGPANARHGNDPNFLSSPSVKPGRRRELSLDGPLPWRDDNAGFHPRVIELARALGYT